MAELYTGEQEGDGEEEEGLRGRFVLVRAADGEETLSLTANLRGRAHSLLRSKDEPVSKALKRVSIAAAKTQKTRKGRKHDSRDAQSPPVTPIEAHLHLGSATGPAVDGSLPNIQAWVEGNVLVVEDVHYTVRVNPPTVVSLRLPKFVMSGCPIIPEVKLEFADLSSCSWAWSRYGNPNPATELPAMAGVSSQGILPLAPTLSEEQLAQSLHDLHLQEHPVISTRFIYCPGDEDFGYQLLLRCSPARSGGGSGKPAYAVTRPVMHFPKATPISRRHQHTQTVQPGPNHFRVISYNVLAEPFTNSPYAHQVLYPYCHPDALDMDYRHCLIVHELLGYRGDVVCLQEVGEKSFLCFFQPAMREKGYLGVFCKKYGQICEGEAIFYNTTRFSMESSSSVNLGQFLRDDAVCTDLYEGLKAAPAMLQSVLTKTTIVLCAFLKCRGSDNRYLCALNTHLYFHPRGDHIRLVQAAVCLRYLEKAIKQFKERIGVCEVATVFCGDFNTCPCIAAYSYLSSGSVGRDHSDWMLYKGLEMAQCSCGNERSSEEKVLKLASEDTDVVGPEPPAANPKEEEGDLTMADGFSGLEIHHPFHLTNISGTAGYTNFTRGYCGVLDYIFIDSDSLEVERVIPMPSHEEVTECVALPSIYFPSDHLALIADIKWREFNS